MSSTGIINQFSKEAIKMRMMQHASNLWGVKNPNALDPMVRLLMEALSTEIYRAANETQNIEGRILDKIAQLLTPNFLTASKPAHAIMQAAPVNEQYWINPFTKFSIQKRLLQNTISNIKNEEVQVCFFPVTEAKLVKGKVAYIANGYQVFSIDSAGYKHPVARSTEPLPWSECWIALQLDEHITNLDAISLYFDFPSYNTNTWIYQLLPLINVWYNGEKVSLNAGRAKYSQPGEDLGKQIFQVHDVMKQVHSEIEQYYDHKFITIENCLLDRDSNTYPEEVERCFAGALDKLPKNLVWLKIQFPPNYNYEMLSNAFIALNCFPVSNRNLLTSIYSYKGLNSILPLRTDLHERFLAVNKVADTSGREYTEIPYSWSSKEKKGFYSIRHGGVERFDQRSAQDMVSYLLELTRDEVAAFSSLDQTFIRTSLEALAKQLRQIENKTAQLDRHIKQSPSYLVIEPVDTEENIQVDYWVTNGAEANSIRPGTEFACQNNPDIDIQGSVLISESIDGREPLQAGERINMFRYALGSNNRLVTIEDIRNFCKSELGGTVKDIRFSRGLAQSPHPKQGYIRVLEIHLVPQDKQELSREEWQLIAGNLLVKIKNLSPDNDNYNIIVDKA